MQGCTHYSGKPALIYFHSYEMMDRVAMSKNEEIHWTDAQIRWTAENHNLTYYHDDDDVDSDSSSHAFKPDPDRTFSHQFQHGKSTIEIELKGYEEQSDTIYVSTGLTLWRSAEVLCNFIVEEGCNRLETILEQERDASQCNILELGAGLGLVGILAQQVLSPSSSSKCDDSRGTLVVTDGDTNALTLLRQNVQMNTSTAVPNGLPIEVEQLLWGHKTAEVFQKSHGTFDLLLAADAIYVQANVAPLMDTVKVLLKRPGGEFWFSYCRRRQVSVQIENVIHEADSIGLCPELMKEDNDILLYVFHWKEAV